MIKLRTDLALEARDMYSKNKPKDEMSGVKSKTENIDDILITTVEILNEDASEKLQKPIGKYITLESKKIKDSDPETSKKLSYIISDNIKKILSVDKEKSVLIVGLGNWNITPDALGPKVISEIMVTKHLKEYMPEHIDNSLRSVSAFSPGVLGITGIETSDIIKGIAEKSSPSLIIAIDALKSSSPDRISTTIQITDTGITPGSGIGNKRKGIDFDTLGIPVIAIGVPTVVDALTIASEVLDDLFLEIKNYSQGNIEFTNMIENLKSYSNEILSCSKENEIRKEMIVAPKEMDSMISHISKIIANGINLALHDGIDLDYIETFTY